MNEKKPINVEVGKQIQRAREKAGLTQDRLAELIGLGPKSVSALERGTVGISLSTMRKICRVLSVSSDTLLFGPAAENDMANIVSRLERLSPEQFALAKEVLDKMVEAFKLSEK